MPTRRALLLALLFPALPLAAQEPEDPYLWLEEVEGARAMEWVRAHNQATLAEMEAHPAYAGIYQRMLALINDDERLALPKVRGAHVYNVWQDERNPRGVWRRTSWDAYVGGAPAWETVMDLDSLAAAEGVTWAWDSAACLEPEHRRCLVSLSRGGADAVTVREFDAVEKRFVPGGFVLPEAKQTFDWAGPDALLVVSDFGPGTLTRSGYARTARIWRRGTPLSEARTIFEAAETDLGLRVNRMRGGDRAWRVLYHRPTLLERTPYLLDGERLLKLDLPLDADAVLAGDQLAVYLRGPWETGGRTHPAGAVVAMPLARFLAGERDFQTVLQTGERTTVQAIGATRDHLLVTLLDNVRGELRRYTHRDGAWTGATVPVPGIGSVGVADVAADDNRYLITFAGFLQPATMYVAEEDGRIRQVSREPDRFDASGLVVEQLEATSRDGTRIPYFVIRRADLPLDGSTPTVMFGYGGFEVPITPFYSATTGAAWMERGGAFVVPAIRGGGEFGPAWHRAARREHRQRGYDDFIAVAQDLVARRITSPRRLGIWGGSNGGLLVGAAFTQRPDLFNAVVAEAPLMDMRRYTRLLAGASWIAEYGDPDRPEEWAFLRRYSPYHNLRPGQPYPRVLLTTTTRDDRVHPAHARKMAARMEEMGYPVHFFENTEGGHGSGVTPQQQARALSIVYTYFLQRLAN